jgi:hypothetical protein
MRTITSLVIIALIAITGIVSAQDLVKTDTYPVQDLIVPLNLSGTDFKVFATAYFNDGWVLVNSDSWTPSQNAFVKDNPEDGMGLGGEPLPLGSMVKKVKNNQRFLTPAELSNQSGEK